MTSLRNAFLATALAVAPFAFAAPAVQASTVTGSLTYAADVVLNGSVTGAAWEITGTGSFSATGGFSDISAPADDWEITGTIGIPGVGSISGSQTWGAPISAMGLLGQSATPPFSVSSLLFTLFSGAMTLGGSAIPGGAEDSYVFQGGVLPLGDELSWKIDPPTVNSFLPSNIDVTGDFVFTLGGSNVGASLLSLSSFLSIDLDDIPPGLIAGVLGALADTGLPLELSLTLKPINHGTPPGVIPLPAALPLLAGGLGVLGVMGWRRRRA